MTRAGEVQITCTCISPARCTPRKRSTQRLVAFVNLHQCTKSGAASLPFPEIRGALVKNVIRLWHVQHAPLGDGKPKGSRFTVGAVYHASEPPVHLAVWPVAVTTNLCSVSPGATWHVTRGVDRPGTVTIVVPKNRHVERYHPRPDRTSPQWAFSAC